MTDLRAAVEGLTPEGRIYVHPGAATCVRACHEYDKATLRALIPEGAVLVTEEGLARALDDVDQGNDIPTMADAERWAAAILRHLRGTP